MPLRKGGELQSGICCWGRYSQKTSYRTQHLKLEPPGAVQRVEASFPSFQHLQEEKESHKPPGPVQHGLESKPGGTRDAKAAPPAAPRAREPRKGWGCFGGWREKSSENFMPRAAFPPSSTPFFLGLAELGLFIPSPSTGVRQRLHGCGRRERASVKSQPSSLTTPRGARARFPWHGEQQQGK